MASTRDGGFILTGVDLSDLALIRMDAEGNVVWRKAIGGGSADFGFAVQETTDGGFIAAGRTESFGAGRSDMYLVKTDARGNVDWQQTYGGAGQDFGHDVQEVSEGGYVVFGWTDTFEPGRRGLFLVRTDEDGKILWQRTYGDERENLGHSVRETADGGFILAGQERFASLLIRTDRAGEIIWKRAYPLAHENSASSVRPSFDGGFVIAGWTRTENPGGRDSLLFKTNSDGELLWSSRFGGSGDDYAEDVEQLVDGGFVLVGIVDTSGPDGLDAHVVRTDAAGELFWQASYGGPGLQWASSVRTTDDFGYVVAGNTESVGPGRVDVDGFLFKLGRDPALQPFRRGDSNLDGEVDVSDAIKTLRVLFLELGELRCEDAADADDTGEIEMLDAIHTLQSVFLREAVIPIPGPSKCGFDPTEDDLTCESFAACEGNK